ncbi:HesA/MoeB/ThiF family protein [Herbaspirillum autotrophicum]|uniref:HesA/MoeB/ThiF family protein n=1 Tax=Herbaspirillum autotrophicum TaxID=180195 RepID=UPI00067A855A|nr:HesA/MoeB/ThiF family protein [Herbaspirillum autotrophicum]
MNIHLSESVYYARHFRLPGFNEQTQQKLRSAKVLIAGVGGLGCPVALYLAGAGIGTITLCDGDEVSPTNLHRQVLFDTSCIGRKKATIAAERLQAINPYIHIEAICQYVNTQLLLELVPRFDVIIDCTDNFDAKYAINDAADVAGVPLVYGSIFQFEGRVSVFHYPTANYAQGLSYRDIHPEAPPSALAQNCGDAGVIGVLPGIIGTLQANEAIKVITGLGETLSGFLLIFDALSATTRKLTLVKRNHAKVIQEQTDDIIYSELLERMASAVPPTLIDVREFHERKASSIGGQHIPLATLHQHVMSLPRDRDIVIYCKSGMRSAKAALYLRSRMDGIRVLHLTGGIDACIGGGVTCKL